MCQPVSLTILSHMWALCPSMDYSQVSIMHHQLNMSSQLNMSTQLNMHSQLNQLNMTRSMPSIVVHINPHTHQHRNMQSMRSTLQPVTWPSTHQSSPSPSILPRRPTHPAYCSPMAYLLPVRLPTRSPRRGVISSGLRRAPPNMAQRDSALPYLHPSL